MWLKDLLIPSSNAQKTIEVAQLWEVRWRSRENEFDYRGLPQVESFLSEQEAVDFKRSLQQAMVLVRSKDFTEVTITKAK